MSKSKEKILLLLTDFITINLAWLVYSYIRLQTGWFVLIIAPEFILPMLVIYFYWLIIFTFVGMYRTWFASSRFDEISTLFKASFFGVFLLFFLIFIDDYMHNVATATRILIFIYWGLFLLFVGSGRIIIRSVQRNLLIKGIGRRNGLIIGFNSKAKEVLDSVLTAPALGIDIKAFVAVNNENIGKDYKDIKVENTTDQLVEIMNKYDVKEIIIALEKEDHDVLVDVITKTEGRGVNLKIVPDLYEILSGQARTSQIYGMPLIDIMPELMPEWEKKLKRLMDIFISFLILVLSSPITLLTAVAIKIDSKGPVFFKQERLGQNGKPFNVIKFRSMIQDAEKYTGPVWSKKDDPRVTRMGKFVRKVRIDEIPQMFNVLKGEMSLVGPRPERAYFVEKLSQEIPYYRRRLKVRPGVTGWAQIKHKYDESIEDVKIKLKYDLFYIENMSLRMDFKILLRTVYVVLFAKGHYD
ncbi:MAG TPA: sugar transferase [Ignavibacteriaceae bacterium]|nr:MAG: exopolysaccharide biosynthesis polyprenyl glycosylphosphotransferase [Ignavibacteriales bacterium UTCHB2]HQF41830.1 sugar transferase [Ignavibacteriaceae bacterium]HQI40854.1 sugar transferase [Ignavibacteriaceae bacterium]